MNSRIWTLFNVSFVGILLVETVMQSVAQNELQLRIAVSHWVSKRDQYGNALCSTNTPSQTTMAGSRMQCQRRCSSAFSCWNFNYYAEDNCCQLFNYKPVNFTTQCANCHYFEFDTNQLPDGNAISQFKTIGSQSNLYNIVFQILEWTDGVEACRRFSPRAHLVVFDTEQEFDDVSAYLRTLSSAQYAPCTIVPPPIGLSGLNLGGYWTAGQRVDPTQCKISTDKTEFRWKPDNGTATPMNPSWGWQVTDPNCVGSTFSTSPPNFVEACVGIIINLWQFVDMSCYWPRCPICELEM